MLPSESAETTSLTDEFTSVTVDPASNGNGAYTVWRHKKCGGVAYAIRIRCECRRCDGDWPTPASHDPMNTKAVVCLSCKETAYA